MPTTATTRVAIFLVFGSIPPGTAADEHVHPFISSEYAIQLGAFFPSKEFRLRVDGSVGGANAEFEFERATGISEDDEVFEAELTWRFGEKWSARLQHFSADRSARAVLRKDITWQDQGILAGSSVTAGTEFRLTRAFFGRSFDHRPHVDTGVGLGLHWLEIGAFIKPDIITTSANVSAARVSGPLPNIGGWYYYSPSPKWFVGGRLDWLEASVDRYDGGIVNVSAGVNYQVFEHVGIGLKYQRFRLAVDVDNDKWRGRVELDYDGPYLYLSGSW